jgi:hypothetical protein
LEEGNADRARRFRLPERSALLAVLASTALACDDTDSGPADADAHDHVSCPDVSLPVESNPFDGVVASFVVDSLRLGDIYPYQGFNLDCANTPPGHAYLPEDGPDGIDNQFGALVHSLVDAWLDVDVDGDIQRSIDDGRNLLLFRLADVDDWADDPGLVYLSVYRGIDVDADPANNLTGRGELLVDEASLLDPDNLLSARSFYGDGILHVVPEADRDIRIGDFGASGADLELMIAAGGIMVPLPIHATRVIWDVEAAPVGEPPLDGRLVEGLLGGSVPLTEGVRFIMTAYADLLAVLGADENTVRGLAAGQADMDLVPEGFADTPCTVRTFVGDCAPGQTCESDPSRGNATFCYESADNLDAISAAFVFTAVSCDVVGIHHAAAP